MKHYDSFDELLTAVKAEQVGPEGSIYTFRNDRTIRPHLPYSVELAGVGLLAICGDPKVMEWLGNLIEREGVPPEVVESLRNTVERGGK